jgi:hypothetical protein
VQKFSGVFLKIGKATNPLLDGINRYDPEPISHQVRIIRRSCLREITREIIKLLEDVSGFPVVIKRDSNLPTIATVKIARRGMPGHMVIYKNIPGEPPDYPICFECAFALRLFQLPPDERFLLASSETGESAVEKILKKSGGLAQKYRMNKKQISAMQAQFLDGLITHLRSVPVGLRVNEWLTEKYPELEELQKKHVQKELEMGKQSLSAQIREFTPDEIYGPSEAINCAYALFWAEKYNRPEISNPYRLQGFEKEGKAILDIWKDLPIEPDYDRELIDKWGEYLEIQDWYRWIPYKALV